MRQRFLAGFFDQLIDKDLLTDIIGILRIKEFCLFNWKFVLQRRQLSQNKTHTIMPLSDDAQILETSNGLVGALRAGAPGVDKSFRPGMFQFIHSFTFQ